MENSLDFFEINDIKEISKKTCINEEDLNRLKNSEFEKFTKTKGLGFIKIIEREYKVDLSELREEFLRYIDINKKQSNPDLFVATPKKNNRAKYTAIIILVFFSAVILYFLYMSSQNDFGFKQQNFDKNPIIEEAQKATGISEVNKTEISEKTDTNDSQVDLAVQGKSKKIISSSDSQDIFKASLTESNISKSAKKLSVEEQNISTSSMKANNIDSKNIEPVLKSQNEDVLIIVPKKKIWIGEISLKNYKKRSFLRDYNITIKVDSDILITTGHGLFDIMYKGKKYNFSSKRAVKLLVDNLGVKEISRDEFLKLNRGKYW